MTLRCMMHKLTRQLRGSSGMCAFSTARERGISFENDVAAALAKYKCELKPTAMSLDGGIDHHGTWKLPDQDVRVVTQCKNEQKPTGVAYLREFEGVLAAQPHNTIGVFASASGFSIHAKRFFSQMRQPAIRLTLQDHRIVEFDMNGPARRFLPMLVPGTTFQDALPVLVLMYNGHELSCEESTCI